MSAPLRSQKLDIRLSPQAKSWLQAAALDRHKSLSEFVLESALSKAQEVLIERRAFELDAENWASFVTALDAPPRELLAVKDLFAKPSVFE